MLDLDKQIIKNTKQKYNINIKTENSKFCIFFCRKLLIKTKYKTITIYPNNPKNEKQVKLNIFIIFFPLFKIANSQLFSHKIICF